MSSRVLLGIPIIDDFGLSGPNLLPSLATVASMMAGTMFAIWLGQLISEYGIRNQGLSLIIFAGIISQVPTNFARIMSDAQSRWFIVGLRYCVDGSDRLAIVYVRRGPW